MLTIIGTNGIEVGSIEKDGTLCYAIGVAEKWSIYEYGLGFSKVRDLTLEQSFMGIGSVLDSPKWF